MKPRIGAGKVYDYFWEEHLHPYKKIHASKNSS